MTERKGGIMSVQMPVLANEAMYVRDAIINCEKLSVNEMEPEASGDLPFGWGCMKGKMWMADDWDEPLEDFKEYME